MLNVSKLLYANVYNYFCPSSRPTTRCFYVAHQLMCSKKTSLHIVRWVVRCPIQKMDYAISIKVMQLTFPDPIVMPSVNLLNVG